MAYIFISYARSDGLEIAQELKNALQAGHQHKAFLDLHNIPGSGKWEKVLEQEIKACDILVILVTDASNESKWVYREFKLAEQYHKPVFPIMIEAGLPPHLLEYNAIELKGTDITAIIREVELVAIEIDRRKERRLWRNALIAVALIAIVAIGFLLFRPQRNPDSDSVAISASETNLPTDTVISPSETVVPSETALPTNTPIPPSETALPTNTPIPLSETPEQTDEPLSFTNAGYTIPLEDATMWTEENLGLQYGEIRTQVFGGMVFEIGRGISTIGCHIENTTNEITISMNVRNPSAVHFLIQGGNALDEYANMEIGFIRIFMSDGSTLVVPLIIGHNIRDWKINSNDAVTTLVSDQTVEAWATDEGRIDMLSVIIPDIYPNNTSVVNIEIVDTSDKDISDPCIHLTAITIVVDS